MLGFEVTPFATAFQGAEGSGRAFVLGGNPALGILQEHLKSTLEDVAKKKTQAAKEVAELDVDAGKIWDADQPYFAQELGKFRDRASDFYKWSYSNPREYGTEEYFKRYNELKKESDRLKLEADMSSQQKQLWGEANKEYSFNQDQYDDESLLQQANFRGMNIYQRQAALSGTQDKSGKMQPFKLLSPTLSVDYNKMVKTVADNVGDVTTQTDSGLVKTIQVNPYFQKETNELTEAGEKAQEQAQRLLVESGDFAKLYKIKTKENAKQGLPAPDYNELLATASIDILKAKDSQFKRDVQIRDQKEDKVKRKRDGNSLFDGNAKVTYLTEKKGDAIKEIFLYDNITTAGTPAEKNNIDWEIPTKGGAIQLIGRLKQVETGPAGRLQAVVLTDDPSYLKATSQKAYDDEVKRREDKGDAPIYEVVIPIQNADGSFTKNMSQLTQYYGAGLSPYETRNELTGSYNIPKTVMFGSKKSEQDNTFSTTVPTKEPPKPKEAAKPKEPAKAKTYPPYMSLDEGMKKRVDAFMKKNNITNQAQAVKIVLDYIESKQPK